MIYRTVFAFWLLITCNHSQAQFVTTHHQKFFISNKNFYFIGANYWYGGLLALNKNTGKERLKKELDFLEKKGINNLRILVGAEGEGLIQGRPRVSPALQPTQGKFNVNVLNSLDFLLLEMKKRKMYAVLYVSNNWDWSGGFMQYLNWNKLMPDSALLNPILWEQYQFYISKFYTCEPCNYYYKKQLCFIINHTNIYSKVKYKNDPTIMSWEIANEPRPMLASSVNAYKHWLWSIATLIKKVDKNHMVTLGTEGSIGTNQSDSLYELINKPAQIDYLTVHIWPKNWGWFSDTNITNNLPQIIINSQTYINKQIEVAKHLQKPLVLEEFGLPRDELSFKPSATTSARDYYYQFMFNLLIQSAKENGVIAGANFWAFAGTARPIPNQIFWKMGDDYMGDPPHEEQGLNAVFDCDKTTWQTIENCIKKLNKIAKH